MKGFKFNLQKLLDIREDKEEAAKQIFKEAMDDLKESKDKLVNLKESYLKYSRQRVNGSAMEQKLIYNYITALNLTIEAAKEEVALKEEVVEEKRVDLVKCQQERKTVEVLKENKEKEFIKEQDLIEQRNNDEFALYGFMRTLKGGEKIV